MDLHCLTIEKCSFLCKIITRIKNTEKEIISDTLRFPWPKKNCKAAAHDLQSTFSPLNLSLKTNNWCLLSYVPFSIFSMVMQSDVILGTLLNQWNTTADMWIDLVILHLTATALYSWG